MDSQITGRNMSIISKVDKSRSLSIEYDTNQSTNIGNRKKSILQFLVIIDFDRFQSTSIGNTKKRCMPGEETIGNPHVYL